MNYMNAGETIAEMGIRKLVIIITMDKGKQKFPTNANKVFAPIQKKMIKSIKRQLNAKILNLKQISVYVGLFAQIM